MEEQDLTGTHMKPHICEKCFACVCLYITNGSDGIATYHLYCTLSSENSCKDGTSAGFSPGSASYDISQGRTGIWTLT